MRTNTLIMSALLASALVILSAACLAEDEDRGFLARPPVFLYNEPGVPLTLMGDEIPSPGTIVPGFDATTVSSDEFRINGQNVQPGLDVKFRQYSIGALAGFGKGWGGAISVPWQNTEVNGAIGGLPASSDFTGLGNVAIFAKRSVWQGANNDAITITGGLDLPTGNDSGTFDQSNAATNGYYRESPRRLPISWQPSTGTVNGYLAASYGRRASRLSYEGILAAKFFSAGDEDVKPGNIFIAAANGTYGIGRKAAISLALVLNTQADDSYPQAPPPGVNSALLAGTTNHGTTLFVTPSVRFVLGSLVIGAGVKYPFVKPDDGMVPDTRGFLIIYPNL